MAPDTAGSAGQDHISNSAATVPAVMPNPYRRQPVTCIDCTWHHERGKCPMRAASVSRLRGEIRALRERLADITGEPA